MDTDLDPVVGSWYKNLEKDELFRVIAFDEDRGIVEIQLYDGDLEEIDAGAWFDLEIEPAETPEDWTGPLDDIDEEPDTDDWGDDDDDYDWDRDDGDEEEDDGRDEDY